MKLGLWCHLKDEDIKYVFFIVWSLGEDLVLAKFLFSQTVQGEDMIAVHMEPLLFTDVLTFFDLQDH